MNITKVCRKCLNKLELHYFHNSRFGKYKKTTICKICKSEVDFLKNKINAGRNKKIHNKYSRTDKGRYFRLKTQTKLRGLELNISLEQYCELMLTKECYYCGGALNNTGSGLDRIDSSKGYSLDNVVKCCKICNQMKNDLGQVDFFEHINNIYAKHVCGKAEFYE